MLSRSHAQLTHNWHAHRQTQIDADTQIQRPHRYRQHSKSIWSEAKKAFGFSPKTFRPTAVALFSTQSRYSWTEFSFSIESFSRSKLWMWKWKWVYRYRERNFPNDPLRLRTGNPTSEQPKTSAQVCHLFLSSTMFSPISRVCIRVCSLFCFCFSFFCGKMKGEPKKSIYIYIRKRSLQARQPLPTPVFPTIFPAVSRLPFFLTCHAFFPSQTPPLILPRQWENSRQTFFRFACNSSSLQRRWKQRKRYGA